MLVGQSLANIAARKEPNRNVEPQAITLHCREIVRAVKGAPRAFAASVAFDVTGGALINTYQSTQVTQLSVPLSASGRFPPLHEVPTESLR